MIGVQDTNPNHETDAEAEIDLEPAQLAGDERHHAGVDLAYDHATGIWYAHHDSGGSATFSTVVIHALASVAETDVSSAEQSVERVLGRGMIDALRLADGPDSDAHAAFTGLGYEVRLWSSGEIEIEPRS